MALMIEQAVISCGGLPDRRGAPLSGPTGDILQPLLWVGEAPFLDVLLFELGGHGTRRILLLAGRAVTTGLLRERADRPGDPGSALSGSAPIVPRL